MCAHPGAQSCQDIAHERIAVFREPVMDPFPGPPRIDEARAPHQGEMARDLRLIEPEGVVQIADADLAAGQKVQQAKPRWVRQGLEKQCRVR